MLLLIVGLFFVPSFPLLLPSSLSVRHQRGVSSAYAVGLPRFFCHRAARNFTDCSQGSADGQHGEVLIILWGHTVYVHSCTHCLLALDDSHADFLVMACGRDGSHNPGCQHFSSFIWRALQGDGVNDQACFFYHYVFCLSANAIRLVCFVAITWQGSCLSFSSASCWSSTICCITAASHQHSLLSR